MAATQTVAAENGGSRGPDILGAIVSTWCVAIIAVGLRTAARRVSKAGFWIDDWLIYASTLLYTVVLALFIESVRLGAGRHIKTVKPEVFERIEILFFCTEIVFPWSLGLVKSSVLAFYWRIFHVSSIRRPIYVVTALVWAWVIAFTFSTIFQCTPPHKLWQPKTHGHCVSKFQYFLGTSIPEVITDFIILAMPLPYIWRLQMKPRQKIQLSVVFLLGGFAAVSSILRLWAFVTRNYKSPDLTYTTANPSIWACVEASIAIISACLPSLRPLFGAMGAMYSRLMSKYSRSSSPSSSSNSKRHGSGPAIKTSSPQQFRKESSETNDKTKLHSPADVHPMAERFNGMGPFADLDTSRERSGSGSEDLSISRAAEEEEGRRNWEYNPPPAETEIEKGPDQV